MSLFSKTKKYRKPSRDIDEKVKSLNKELEKTGLVVEAGPANSTSGVYNTYIYHPEAEEEESVVPDPTGFRNTNPSGPAANASDIDPSDSSTWATGGQGMDDLINPNALDVSNGDNVTDQPVVDTPDLTGFKPLRSDPNNPDSSMNKYGGIAKTGLLGVWGTSTGIIGEGNKFETVLAAFGWPTGPDVPSGSPDYPSDRKYGGFYRMDDDKTYSARLKMRAHMDSLPENQLWVPYKCWMPFNSYGFGQTWTQYKANASNIWREDGHAYVQVMVYAGPGKYKSQESVPPYHEIINRYNLGDAGYYPGDVGGFLAWLRDRLELSDQGWRMLEDELRAGGLPYGTPGADDPFADWDDDLSDDDLLDDSDFDMSEWEFANYVKDQGLGNEDDIAKMPDYVKDSIKRQYSGKGYTIEDKKNIINWQQRIRAGTGGNTDVAHYEPQGELIKEGWASPEHVNVDKDEKKRWFNPKEIHPEYPREEPPEIINGYSEKMLPKLDTPIPYIKVKRKDLIRAHKLKKHEAQEYVDLVNKLNEYIKRNPHRLAYIRERYPKSDPRLAELNFKMDMQIAASDEYLDKQFPENQRLYGKLMQATKRSIALTDPKTYKDKKGKMTSYKKLLRVDHVVSEYSIKERDIKNRKIGYGGKKKSVSKLLNKPIKKTNNMFGSLDVSDMKKTTAKKVNEKKIQETKLITDKKYIQDQMNILRSDWKKELNLNERMTTTGVLQYQLAGSDTDHIVVQTGYTGDGDINDFTYGNSEREAVHHGGEFTAFTAFTSTENAPDPQNMGTSVRSFGGQDENGNYDLSPTTSDGPTGATDNMGNFWPGYTGGLRGTHFYQAYNTFPYTALGGPTDEDAVGFFEQEPDEPQEYILSKVGSAQLVGTGFAGNAGVPRILAMRPVDTTEMDTFSLNWFTLGNIITDNWHESPTYGQKFTRDHFRPIAQGDGVYLYYWAGDKPGAQIYGPQMSGWGNATRNYTGWRPINRRWDGTLDPDVDPHIIPDKPYPLDENGEQLTKGPEYVGPYRGNTRFNHKLTLPEWCRGKDMRFMLIQKRMSQGAAYNRWGLTSIRFQRRAPMSVVIPLDSPEASSFVRLGQSPSKKTSPKQRKKKVEDILKASKSYVNKVVGDPFPGTGAKIGEAQGTNEKPYVPHQWDDKRKEFGDVGTLDQQKDKFVSKDVKLAPNYSEVQNQEDPQDTEPKYPADKTSDELIKALKIPNEKDFSDRSEYNKAVEAYHNEQFDIIWEKHDPLNNPSFMANTDYTPNDTLISRMRVYISPERSATAVRQSAYMYQDPSKGYIDVMTGKTAQYQPPIDVEPTNSHNHAKIYPGSPEFSEADFRGIAPSHYWSASISDSIAFLYQRGPDGLVYKNIDDIGNSEKGQDPKKFLKALMRKTSSLRNGMPPLSPLELVNYHRQYTTNSSKSPTGTHRPGEARYQEYIARIKEVFASNGWEHNIPEEKYSSSPPSVDVRNMTSKERHRYQASIKAKAALKDFEQSEKEYKKVFDRQRKKGIHKKGDWHGYKITSKDERGLTKTAIERKPRTYQNDRAERWFKVKSAADYLLGGEMYTEPKMSAYPSDTDRQMGQAAHRYLMQKQKK